MTVYQAMKTDRINSMKAKTRAKTSLLSTIVGELESKIKRDGKDVSLISDEMVVAVCKKFIANNNETIKLTSGEQVTTLIEENAIMESYLPSQLTASELGTVIAGLNASNIGEVMRHLKTVFPGRYDGKLASKLAREIL